MASIDQMAKWVAFEGWTPPEIKSPGAKKAFKSLVQKYQKQLRAGQRKAGRPMSESGKSRQA